MSTNSERRNRISLRLASLCLCALCAAASFAGCSSPVAPEDNAGASAVASDSNADASSAAQEEVYEVKDDDDKWDVGLEPQGYSSYEKAFEAYAEANASLDPQGVAKLLPPGYYIHRVADRGVKYELTPEEAARQTNRSYAPSALLIQESVKAEDPRFDCDYAILNTYEATKDETAELAVRLSEVYGVTGKISDSVLISYDLRVGMGENAITTRDGAGLCAKVDGEWYFLGDMTVRYEAICCLINGLKMEEVYIQWMLDWYSENVFGMNY